MQRLWSYMIRYRGRYAIGLACLLATGTLAMAVPYLLKRAVELSPRSELASVGLFHSLWDLGKVNQAFAEMRRFLRLSDSPEYSKLLRDLTVEGRLVPQPAVVS